MSNIYIDSKQLNEGSVFRQSVSEELSQKQKTDLLQKQKTDFDAQQISRSKTFTDLSTKTEDAGKLIGLVQASANERYLDRILQNSIKKNLAFQVIKDRKLEKDGFVNVKTEKAQTFSQQYPAAIKDKFFGSSENDQIKKAKRVFRNADLNTVREYPALRKFIKSQAYTSGPAGAEAKDEVFDKNLVQYVNYLFHNSFDSRSLTEEYLSRHINEVYEYSWKLSQYNDLKAQYPSFFAGLPETKKITLERMASAAEGLKDLLDSHLYLHGIKVQADDKGVTHVYMRKEPENKAERHQKRQELKAAYDQKYQDFMQKTFTEKEYALAKQFADNEFINESQDLIAALNKTFGEGTEVKELFGPMIEAAMAEIERTLAVRNELVEEQRRNLASQDGQGRLRDDIRHKLKHTNDKLMLCSEHIDVYKQYLYFLNGNIQELPKSTVEFLVREKHEDLLEPVKFKAEMQCIQEAMALNEYLDEEDSSRESKAKAEKKAAFKPTKLSKEQFYEKRRLLLESMEKRDEKKRLDEDWTRKKNIISERASEYAKEHHLKPQKANRYALGFMDPKGEFLKEDEFFWIFLAGMYQPTDQTPDNIRKEIIEKGIRPWIKFALETDPQDYEKLKIKSDEEFDAEGYAERRAKILLGHDMLSFLGVIRAYGQELNDDEYTGLVTYGKVMEGFASNLDYLQEKTNIPVLRVIGKTDGFLPNAFKVFDLLSDSGSMLDHPEVVKLLQRYDTESNGLLLDGETIMNGQTCTDNAVPDYLSTILKPAASLIEFGHADNVDLAAEYQKKLRNVKQKSDSLQSVMMEKEVKRLTETGYAEMSEDQLMLRLYLKSYKEQQDNILNKDQITAFQNALGEKTEGEADIRSFKQTLNYVAYDANGSVREAYREKERQNRQDISDYIEGGERRKEYLKRKVKQILGFNITEDMLTLDYIRDHYSELSEMNQIMHGFRAIAADNAAFLESDAFSEAERDAFRLRYTENPILDTLGQILESYAGTVGMKETGDELEVSAFKDKNALAQEQARRQQSSLELTQILISQMIPENIETYKKLERVNAEKPEMVRRLAGFEAELKSRSAEFKKEKAQGKISSKAKNKWQEYLPLAQEIKNYLYGVKDSVSDKALVFAEENGFGKYFEPKQIEDAAFRIETEALKKAYGYPIGKTGDPQEAKRNEDELRGLLGIDEKGDIEKAIEDNAKTGLAVRKFHNSYNNAFSDAQTEAFKEKCSNTGDDARCFERLFEPVRRDIFGRALPEDEENEKENGRILEDYLSGDQARVNSVLRKMADKVLDLDLSPAKMTEEYIKEHTEEITKTVQIIFRFQNYYYFRHDFFTGDAFTKEEQINLRKKMELASSGMAISVFNNCILKNGYEPDSGYPHDMSGARENRLVFEFRRKCNLFKATFNSEVTKYNEALKREADSSSPEKDEQLRQLVNLSGRAKKLGLSEALYKSVQKLADNDEEKLGREGRKELEALVGEFEEVKADTYARETDIDLDSDDIKKIRKKYPWMDKISVEKLGHSYLLVDYNKNRINASDSLYSKLVRLKDNPKLGHIDELKGEIKAYTDRLLSLKLDETTLNDEYISEHPDLFIEYVRAHFLLPHMQEYYPELLDSLSVADRVSIMYRNENYKKIDNLIAIYMEKDGLTMTHSFEKLGKVKVWLSTYVVDTDKEKFSKEDAKKGRELYEQALKEAVDTFKVQGEVGKGFVKARTEEFFGIKEGISMTRRLYDYAAIEESLKKNEAVYKNARPYYDRILKKYREEAEAPILYEAKAYMDSSNASREKLNEIRKDIERLQGLKTAGSPEYDPAAETQAREAEKRELVNLRASENRLEGLEKSGPSLLRLYKDLEKYQELFRLGAGEGGILSEETEDFLNKKGLTSEYGMILTSIVLSKKESDIEALEQAEEEKLKKKAEEVKAEQAAKEKLEKKEEEKSPAEESPVEETAVKEEKAEPTTGEKLEKKAKVLAEGAIANALGELEAEEESPAEDTVVKEEKTEKTTAEKLEKKAKDLAKGAIADALTELEAEAEETKKEEEKKKQEEDEEIRKIEEEFKKLEQEEKKAEEEKKSKIAAKIDKYSLPVIYEEAGPELSVSRLRKIYNKKEFDERAKALVKAGIAVPATRDELVVLREASDKFNKYLRLIKMDGKDTVEQTWAEDADPVMKENYDWMMEYFRVNDSSLDLYLDKERLLKPLAKKNYSIPSIALKGMNAGFERQTGLNCFCCTATAMVSHMYSRRKKSKDYIKVGNQYKMRAYQPAIRKYDQSFEKEASVSMIQYSKQVKDLYAYCGEGKNKTGNIFEDADYLLEQLENTDLHITDVCVNSVRINYPEEKDRKTADGKIKAENQIEAFKQTIKEATDKKNIVGVFRSKLTDRHYVTITGLKGDTLTVYDSSGYNNKPREVSIASFFKGVETIELNWLSDMPKPAELTAEYSNLTYNKQTGFGLKHLEPEAVRYVGHTRGVTLRKSFDDMGPGMDGVTRTIYIPNQGKRFETQPYEDFAPYAELDEVDEERKAAK